MNIYLYFDGACLNNGYPNAKASYGWLLKDDLGLLACGSGLVPQDIRHTNNVAEFMGLEQGLKAILDLKLRREFIICRGDSQLVINTFNKKWRCSKTPHLKLMVERIRALLVRIFYCKMEWIPREHNKEADLLSVRDLPPSEVKAHERKLQEFKKWKKGKKKRQ